MLDVSEAIDLLLEGAVPERAVELKVTWGEQSDRVRLQPGDGFMLQQGFGAIQVNELALKQVWFIGYAAQKAIEAYSGVILVLERIRLPFNLTSMCCIDGQAEADEAFDRRMKLAIELIKVKDLADFDWPADVPFPLDGPRFSNVIEKATYDLVCMAGSYIFLHKIRHAPLGGIRENPRRGIGV